MAHPVAPLLRDKIAAAAAAENIAFVNGGTYVCIEGPQFSSLAKSLAYKAASSDVIGMTAMPEAKLAREAEISYATIAMVTDFDCWHPEHDSVDVASVIRVVEAMPKMRRNFWPGCCVIFRRSTSLVQAGSDRALDHALLTPAPARESESHEKTGGDHATGQSFMTFDLKDTIRAIPDYPKQGIMFRDIATLSGDARAFRRAIDELVQPWAGTKIDKVAGIERRGFILGGAVAHQLSAGFVPIRKKASCRTPRSRLPIRWNMVSTRWRCTRMPWRPEKG